jgi:hypothetical protein
LGTHARGTEHKHSQNWDLIFQQTHTSSFTCSAPLMHSAFGLKTKI